MEVRIDVVMKMAYRTLYVSLTSNSGLEITATAVMICERKCELFDLQ